MEKSNDLRYYFDRNTPSLNCRVKIRLNDECKNGHQDFAMTGTFWIPGKVRRDGSMITAGCCHEEIVKHFPELEIFVNLHLCDYSGIPLHAVSNMVYHMHKGFSRIEVDHKTDFCKYYRINSEQYDVLKNATEKDHFYLELVRLNILNQWKDEANEGIKFLEEKTGKEFLNDSVKSNLETYFTPEKLAEIVEQAEKGFYNFDKVQQRENERITKVKNDKIQDLKDTFEKKTTNLKRALELDLYLVETFGSRDNTIIYEHRKEVVFNWNPGTHNRVWTETEIQKAVPNFKNSKYFEGYTFKNGK